MKTKDSQHKFGEFLNARSMRKKSKGQASQAERRGRLARQDIEVSCFRSLWKRRRREEEEKNRRDFAYLIRSTYLYEDGELDSKVLA